MLPSRLPPARAALAGAILALFGCDRLAGQQTETFWAYRPLARPAVPAVRDGSWVRNPIDAFVLSRLEANGIAPAAPAPRVALLRRATYDLTGLPPTLDEVESFLGDDRPDAYERLIDRLLDSPQYGVKWGRHWLDLVRFAETDSYERDRRKPAAWRYRDYVVDALNRDKPFDRFLVEQLAGDEVDGPTLETIVATGYYRLGIWDDEPTDTLQAVYDDFHSIVDTTSRVVLGMSLGCARCHAHKRDPIPQEDYYRFLAFFENIRPYKVGGGNNVTPSNYLSQIPVDLGSDDFADRLRAWERERDELTNEAQNLAREARSRLDDAARSAIEAERSRGLVVHLGFDDPEALGCEVEGASLEPRGRIGSALAFDGRDDVARVRRPVASDFTIAFWFRADRPGAGSATDLRWFRGSGLVDAETRGVADDFGVGLVADRVVAGTGRPERHVSSQGGLADGAWHHVAFVRERGTGRIALHLDGSECDSKVGGSQALDATEFVTIGRMQPGYNSFAGAIDDVRIYERALDRREVLDLFVGGGLERATGRAVEAWIGRPEAARYAAAVERLVALRRPTRETVQVLCVKERGAEPPESFVRIRGNAHAKGDPVTPAVPVVFGGSSPVATPPAGGRSTGRRRALAEWLVRDDCAPTWRVLANRLWQHHFGRGIVRTPNDFGHLGELPTHPELLDWLATELVQKGSRLKAMHRLIMTSQSYRMSSAPNPSAAAKDPRNDLFWRFEMRRLSAEEIRDSILAVTGTLNLKLGGPGVYPKLPEAVLATASRPAQAWGKSPPAEAARRSLYIHVKRSLLHPLLVAFDLADTDASCPVRYATTQPTQALTMLNGDFANEQAALLADRLRREAQVVPARVALGLRLATQRAPTRDEVEQGVALIRRLRSDDGLDADAALNRFCLVLINLNEFSYLD